MIRRNVFGSVCALVLLLAFVPAASAGAVEGHSQGNHDLGCRLILPSTAEDVPEEGYPVIVWADGWYQGNVNGADTNTGYLPGLQEWADAGPYVVVAGTQWSARETDTLRCLTWIAGEDADSDSDLHGLIDETRIGLAGHSQGGGAVLKAGDGEPRGNSKGPTLAPESFDITAVVAMNPYGPSFGKPANIDGPVLFLGGTDDTTTPTSSFFDTWLEVKANSGGILADLDGGTHNSEAFGDPPESSNFGEFQKISEEFWDAVFNDAGPHSIESIAADYAANPDWNVDS